MKVFPYLRRIFFRNVGAASPQPNTSSKGNNRTVGIEVAQPASWLSESSSEGSHDSNDQEFTYNPQELPLPNETLRAAVSGPDLGRFLYIGHAWATLCAKYLPPKRQVLILDVGCGVGKMARFLALDPRVFYVGFDIYLPAIQWCSREFSRLYGERFKFEHFDGKSAMYNPNGKTPVGDYRFPVDDSSVDFVLGASIFTHLYEKDMKHYFAETSRVLISNGIALFSIHTPDEYQTFFPDADDYGNEKFIGNEQVILVDRDYFIELAIEYGLKLHNLPGRLCGQELVAFRKS
jgi:SAM-dependent methyltransferase